MILVHEDTGWNPRVFLRLLVMRYALLLIQVHERDKFADFMLILLRMVLPRMPHLRVVLMSATLHVDLFASYFGGCPVIQATSPPPPSPLNIPTSGLMLLSE